MSKFISKDDNLDGKNFFNFDFDDVLGIFLFVLGFIIMGFYGQFFIMLADNTILFFVLSVFFTTFMVLIRKCRDKCREEIGDFYLFICLIIRFLNYMVISIFAYSLTSKIFSSLFSMFSSTTLENLNLLLYVFCAIVPYALQKEFCKRLFNVNI